MAVVETTTPVAPARRGFLALLTGAVALPATVAAAVPAATPLPIVEVPELLAIGDQLPGLLDAFRSALERRAAAVALFESQCLPIPADLAISAFVSATVGGPRRAHPRERQLPDPQADRRQAGLRCQIPEDAHHPA